MKTTTLFFTSTLLLLVHLSAHTQQVSDTLNGNSVAATLFDEGRLFNNRDLFTAGYELPAGSGNHLIYTSGFWFAGINQTGDLKLAASSNGQGADFYRGPYSTTGDYLDPDYLNEYQGGMWTVSKSEIIQHINDYNQPNYVATEAIENWPGNGNTNIGVIDQLAPYVDVNNNNVYDPYQGDYPCIKGDIASYQIMHDDSTHSSSGGERIGAEIHLMVYQIASSNYIDSTTFVEVTVFNRGQNSFSNFKSTLFLDGDIGMPDDEYVGSNPSRNLMYNYNALNSDSGGNGQPGYGANPPTVGIVSLNNDIEYSGVYSSPGFGSPITNGPSSPAGYWYYMNGKWLDGSDWTEGGNGYGGTTSTQHLYDGNPYQSTGWTELDTDGSGTSNAIGDRRFIMTTQESSFAPGDTLKYHYAVIANRRGDHIENVQGIIDYADSVQIFYDNMSNSCIQQGTTSLDNFDLSKAKVNLYPNPATSKIIATWRNTEVDNIIIYSLKGNIVREISVQQNKEEKVMDISGLNKGIYFIKIGSITRKLIVN